MNPYDKLKTLCAEIKVPLRLLIVCPDRVRRERALEYVLLKISAPDRAESVIRLDGAALTQDSIRALKDSASNLSLFSSEKTYVIRNIAGLTAALAEHLRQVVVDPKSVNHFICSADDLPVRSSLTKVFKEQEIVKFAALTGDDLIKWTQQELKRAAIGNTSPETARIISAIASDDCDRIHALIEKLSLYCDSDAVSKEDLKNFDESREKAEEFHFVNLFAHNRKKQAFSYLQKLQAQGLSAFPLTGLLSRMISNYLGLKFARSRKLSQAEIQQILGLSPWAYKKQTETASVADEKKLVRAIQALARADSQIKGKNLGEAQVLAELIANV